MLVAKLAKVGYALVAISEAYLPHEVGVAQVENHILPLLEAKPNRHTAPIIHKVKEEVVAHILNRRLAPLGKLLAYSSVVAVVCLRCVGARSE